MKQERPTVDVKLGTLEMQVGNPYTNGKGQERITLNGKAKVFGEMVGITIYLPASVKIPVVPKGDGRSSGLTSNTRVPKTEKVTRLPAAIAEGSQG